MAENFGEYVDYSNGVAEEIKRKEVDLIGLKNVKEDLAFLRSELDYDFITEVLSGIIDEINNKESSEKQLDYLLDISEKYSKYIFLGESYEKILIYGKFDSNDMLFYLNKGFYNGYINDLDNFLDFVKNTSNEEKLLENFSHILNYCETENMGVDESISYIDSKKEEELSELDKYIIKFFIRIK